MARFGIFHPCGPEQQTFLASRIPGVEDRSFGLFVSKRGLLQNSESFLRQTKEQIPCLGLGTDAETHADSGRMSIRICLTDMMLRARCKKPAN